MHNQITNKQKQRDGKLIELEQSLIKLRKIIAQNSQNSINQTEISEKITFEMLKLCPPIKNYISVIYNHLLSLENNQNQNRSCFKQSNENDHYEQQKISLYVWQIFNFICIKQCLFPEEFILTLQILLDFNIRTSCCHSVNTIKNAHIFIHNLIAKYTKDHKIYQLNESLLIRLFILLLNYHFQRQQSKLLVKNHVFINSTKSEQIIVSQLQWLGYIFKQLFAIDYQEQSLIKRIVSMSQNPKTTYYILHMIGNYFQEMVDKRVTTQLVTGFQCPISDVKEMYQVKGDCLIEIKISKQDLSAICKIFKQAIPEYIQILKSYLTLQINSTQTKQSKGLIPILLRFNQNILVLQQICHILNCVLFIGGYNSKLQDFVIQLLLQEDKTLLSYLQVSYLLYRNIQCTKYQSKVNLMVEVEKQSKKQLFSLVLKQSQVQIQSVDIKSLKLENVLAQGQLVNVLRLLTNLVHINHRAQRPFEQNVKYLHMILSLTHESISQVTMKQWAIIFIRNVSEWSQKLREEIGKIKIQMKVQ